MSRARLLALLGLLALVAGLIWWVWPEGSPEMASPAGPGVSGEPGGEALDDTAGAEATAGKPSEPEVIEAVSASGVSIRIRELPRVAVPKPPYLEPFQALRPGAEEADPITQYALGQMLYRCREVPEQAEELQGQIDRMYQTREVDGWPVDDPELEAQTMRQAFADCEGIPAAERLDFRQWLQRAAEAGLLEAQVNLMFHLPVAEYCQFLSDCSAEQKILMESLREEARVQVGRALEAGSVDAMRTLAGWAINEEMGPVDPVEAWAMFSAYEQVLSAAGEGGEVQRMLDSLEGQLRPVDRERGEARIEAVLANPNCCLLIR